MMSDTYNLRDATFVKSDAMPNNASTTKTGTALDLGSALTARGVRVAECELLFTMPALTTTMAPDTRTMTYSIESSSTSTFDSATTLWSLQKAGAGGAGIVADTFRMKIPSNCDRYVRVKAVSGVSTTDASAVLMKLELLF
jgi:hypothetical protein